jgi:hypothetical protein
MASVDTIKASYEPVDITNQELDRLSNHPITYVLKVMDLKPYKEPELTFGKMKHLLMLDEHTIHRVRTPYGSMGRDGGFVQHYITRTTRQMCDLMNFHLRSGKIKVYLSDTDQTGLFIFSKDAAEAVSAASAASFRSRRRGSKSVKRHRKLSSKSKSKKRSPKPRRR